MSDLKTKAETLANKAIANPELLDQLPNNVYEDFILRVALFNIDLAMKLDDIRPITNSNNKVLFWEAVGIISPQENYS